MIPRKNSVRRFVAAGGGLAVALYTAMALPAPPAASAGTLTLKVCGKWSLNPGPFVATAVSPFDDAWQCVAHGEGLQLWSKPGRSAARGSTARWRTSAPSGIKIVRAHVVNPMSQNIADGKGWVGDFFWSHGRAPVTDRYDKRGCCAQHFRSRYFGWRITCKASTCSRGATLDVGGIELFATETRGPTITMNRRPNLWSEAGRWVRGIWPVRVSASDPSGVCLTSVALGREVVRGPSARRNTDAWQQCPQRTWTAHVDTTRARSAGGKTAGAMKLKLMASNGARVSSSRSEIVNVDNSTPWIKLSGSKYALTTGRTPHITAKAGGSPSGIARITCTIGHKKHSYRGSSAHVVVEGVGRHTIACTAQDNAIDPSGKPAVSRKAKRSLTIRRPTTLTAAFTHLDSQRNAGRHTKRIPFDSRTKFGGRLTVKGGRGLAGQTVRILTAPDNRSGNYSQVARTKTGASGRWQVALPAGPSRLVKAVYDGNSKDAPVKSRRAEVIVPARVKVLRLWPRRVPWGGTVHIRGRLEGGYLPPAPAGELVRLRLGYGRSYTTYGVKTDVTGDGRFSVTYKFGPGSSKVVRHYWFQECTLPSDDYPYAPACSRKITVRVGG